MLLLSGLVTKVCKICADLRGEKEFFCLQIPRALISLVILDDPSLEWHRVH